MLPPENIIIRPPVEAYSILIPITGGCSWNHCVFCGVYKGVQDFSVRDIHQVKSDIDYYASRFPNHPTIFLAGGNPTAAPTAYLVEILKHIKSKFFYTERISCYAKALDIIRKTDSELVQLAQAGLTIVYMGMESGSDVILHQMKKGTTAHTLITASKRLMAAGIQVSLYIILGLGGKERSNLHANETAKVLNQINPTMFRFRTLNIMDNSPLVKEIENKTFTILTPLEVIKEQRQIIAQLSPTLSSAMFNDHISNYLNIDVMNIGQQKAEVLRILDEYISDPQVAEWKHKALKQM